MALLDQLGDLGSNILEAGTDIISGVGDTFQNSADQNAAAVRRMDVNSQLAISKFQADNENRKANSAFLQKVVIAIVVIIGILVVGTVGAKYLKK